MGLFVFRRTETTRLSSLFATSFVNGVAVLVDGAGSLALRPLVSRFRVISLLPGRGDPFLAEQHGLGSGAE